MAALLHVFANKHHAAFRAKQDSEEEKNDVNKIIDDQLILKGVSRDNTVIDLYLAHEKLTKVCPFERFRNLQRLWLNNNKLCSINNKLSTNFSLVELYLQNNELKSINGCLRHLHNLNILMLQNNQLVQIEKVVKELNKMHYLRILNLFNNPAALEQDYRSYVIFSLPSLKLLDRSQVLQIERDSAKRQYDQDYELVQSKIAFSTRSDGPPSLLNCREPKRPVTVPEKGEVGNNYYRNNPVYGDLDEAFRVRCAKKSLMQYSYLDWSVLPPSASRRTSRKSSATTPVDAQIVTVKFR